MTPFLALFHFTALCLGHCIAYYCHIIEFVLPLWIDHYINFPTYIIETSMLFAASHNGVVVVLRVFDSNGKACRSEYHPIF